MEEEARAILRGALAHGPRCGRAASARRSNALFRPIGGLEIARPDPRAGA